MSNMAPASRRSSRPAERAAANTVARLLFQLGRFGWPGALGAALLLAALAADLLANVGLEEEIAARRLEAARRDLLPAVAERSRKLPAQPRERADVVLPRLFAAARRHGLHLDEGRYVESGKDAEARRLQIDLPVSGDYPAVRAFIAEALDDNPSLSLDSLELTRDDIGVTELEARPRFVLNLEAAR